MCIITITMIIYIIKTITMSIIIIMIIMTILICTYIYIIIIVVVVIMINYYYYHITTSFESMQIVLTNRQPPSRNSIAMFMRLWPISSWVVSMVHAESYWQVTYSTSLVSLVGFSMTLSWVGDCKTGYDWCLMLRGLYSTIKSHSIVYR